MPKLVTIGIPVYKRLHYLPQALSSVCAQDYPNIELVVSDNGMNGPKVGEIVTAAYSQPYRFRQNPATVSISTHFNQIASEACGEYFVLLADDDEISPNYISELVKLLELNPQASLAIGAQEIMNELGVTIRRSKQPLLDILTGAEFIRSTWHTGVYRYECFSTFMARTNDIIMCGGYPEFTRGNHNDNALVIKLCLNHSVVLSDRCTFRWRIDESSQGWSVSIDELAEASKQFLRFLDCDPKIQEFALRHAGEWRELKRYIVKMAWETYLWRWKQLYRNRVSRLQWMKAAFAMPLIPAYYAVVMRVLTRTMLRSEKVR